MSGFTVFVLLVLLLGGYVAIVLMKQKVKGYEQYYSLKHISGLPNIDGGINVWIYLYPNEISFNEQISIPLSRVKKTEILTKEQITEKQKSVIKRAIAGGILLGGLGAIIGGVSGVGKKEVQETVNIFSIEYRDINGEDNNILFLIGSQGDKFVIKQISNSINQKIGYIPITNGRKVEI